MPSLSASSVANLGGMIQAMRRDSRQRLLDLDCQDHKVCLLTFKAKMITAGDKTATEEALGEMLREIKRAFKDIVNTLNETPCCLTSARAMPGGEHLDGYIFFSGDTGKVVKTLFSHLCQANGGPSCKCTSASDCSPSPDE